jgi:hypothetical protein
LREMRLLLEERFLNLMPTPRSSSTSPITELLDLLPCPLVLISTLKTSTLLLRRCTITRCTIR